MKSCLVITSDKNQKPRTSNPDISKQTKWEKVEAGRKSVHVVCTGALSSAWPAHTAPGKCCVGVLAALTSRDHGLWRVEISVLSGIESSSTQPLENGGSDLRWHFYFSLGIVFDCNHPGRQPAHRGGCSLWKRCCLMGCLWGEKERNDQNTGMNSCADEDWGLCRGEGN